MSLDREELLDRLRRFPDRLTRIVDQQPADLLCQAGTGGGWGAVEIMAYIRDWEMVVIDWIDHILKEDNPELESYDTDLWSIERDYHAENPAEVVRHFTTLRLKLLVILADIDEVAWMRTARHADGREVTLEQVIADLDAHDQMYMKTLRELLF